MANRRTLFTTLALAGAGYTVWRFLPAISWHRLEFTPLAEPSGFRGLAGGDVTRGSGGFDPFVGLTTPDQHITQTQSDIETVQANLCDALFDERPTLNGPVPVASFSDVRCPVCRGQTRMIADLAEARPDILRVTWHDWPIFGESSMLAAQAGRAAALQGRYLEMHLRLLRTPAVITMAYLTRLSASLDLDVDQLITDMQSAAVTRQIRTSQHLAAIFGFIGTPALVVGRTVVNGGITEGVFRDTLDAEADGAITALC